MALRQNLTKKQPSSTSRTTQTSKISQPLGPVTIAAESSSFLSLRAISHMHIKNADQICSDGSLMMMTKHFR